MRLALTLLLAAAAVPAIAQSTQTAASRQPAAPTPFVKAQAESVVTTLATRLEDDFVFPEVGKAYAARLRQQLAAGVYGSFADGKAFADKVTADLQAVHKDGHLALRVVPAEDRGGPQASGGNAGGLPQGSTILQSGWLADGVAYINFRMFPGNEATMAELRKFLESHRDAGTLIIDARQHRGGGLAEMDMIFPELFSKATALVRMDTREAVERRQGNPIGDASLRLVSGPAGVVRREHYVTPAAKQGGLAKAKVYLLTSKRTASAGEHLALSLKRTRRATLVGETTRGAGHYGSMVPLDDAFTYAAFIPVGRTFDPDTGDGWEGAGVTPDVAVAADQALDKALELAGVKVDSKVALAGLR